MRPPSNGEIRLNKFISNAGICSRREADRLIQEGHITVNEQKVTQLGYRVPTDAAVKYRNKVLSPNRFVYVLLNKPKDCITTSQDPQGRRTVLQLTQNACSERIYPVGRLDRNTTGLLLLTNDGQLASKLAHPSSQTRKLYHVNLDKPITKADFNKIKQGIVLEDGVAHVDQISLVDQNSKSIGIEIHMGRNRIVRRIFEHLGYQVLQLDRVAYAHLTKKCLPRGHWRMLTQKEVHHLKTFVNGRIVA